MYSPQATFVHIDSRPLTYRYDLEADIAWRRIDEPGLYASDRYLRGMGVPVDALHASGCMELYQWLYALHVVEDFIELESNVLQFVNKFGKGTLPQTNSLAWLRDEELKHVRTFQRYRKHLVAQRPQEAARAIAALHAQRPSIGLERPAHVTDAVWHYLFWLETLSFEDYTVYFYEELRGDAGIQPTWADVHRAHAQEEVQHVATDAEYVRALDLSDADRQTYSKQFLMWSMARYKEKFQAPVRLLHHLRPETVATVPVGAPPKVFTEALLRAPAFRATREAAPYIAWLGAR